MPTGFTFTLGKALAYSVQQAIQGFWQAKKAPLLGSSFMLHKTLKTNNPRKKLKIVT